MMKVLDLFCGAGGFSEGFKQEGFEVICGIDFESHKLNTFKKNINPKYALKEDISNLTFKKINKRINNEKVDIVLGSPPCKDYSNANYKKDFSTVNNRAFLHEHFFRLVVLLSPDWFVLENVENFFDTVEGEFFKKKFEPYGYYVSSLTVNSVDFGVPQKRIRGFLIGNKFGYDFILKPIKQHTNTIYDAISDLVDLTAETNDQIIQLDNPLSDYQLLMRNCNNTTMNHACTNHSKETIKKLASIPQGSSAKNIFKISSKNSGAYYRPSYNMPSKTITTRFDSPTSPGGSLHPKLHRCFTPREAARIQSFNDSFHFFGTKREIREQIGDAVPPLISQAIAKKIKKLSF